MLDAKVFKGSVHRHLLESFFKGLDQGLHLHFDAAELEVINMSAQDDAPRLVKQGPEEPA